MAKKTSVPPKTTEPEPFKAWAIVEVMGHKSYAGFVTAETIAGAALLRIDVPPTSNLAGFTKYLSPSALYGISPCTEATARAWAESRKTIPFESWSVEQQVMDSLKEKGLLLEHKQIGVSRGRKQAAYANDDGDE